MSRHTIIVMLALASAISAASAQDAPGTSAATDVANVQGAASATNKRDVSANSDAGAKRQAKATSKASDDAASAKRRAKSATEDGASKGQAQPAANAEEPAAASKDEVKTLSGISILGNQEAPKSLVIVPWKSSEIGDMPGLSRLLDDSVQPIDKEVFMRELDYYEIRSSSR
jgi:flagellar hook-length control protein FliK